jgi:hypothetical protein
VTQLKRIIVVRLLVLTLTLITLHFGGASALQKDALDAVQSVHAGLNSLSDGVTSDLVNLHTTLPDGSGPGS